MTQKLYKYSSIPQLHNFVAATLNHIDYLKNENIPIDPPILNFYGTVKADGTNASVYSEVKENKIINFVPQSKERVLTIDNDNMGFAKYILEDSHKTIMEKIILEVKKQHNVTNETIAVYGEWCGGSIKKKVALSKLPKMFILFNISIKDLKNEYLSEEETLEQMNKRSKWLTPEQIQSVINKIDISLDEINSNQFFHIFQFPNYKITLDFKNLEKAQVDLTELTNNVDKECPIGKYFGVSGVGEGIVWTCTTEHPELNTFNLKFKTKGNSHKIVNKKEPIAIDIEKMNSINQFVDYVLTENRLNQGIDYLKEMQKTIDLKSLGDFIMWNIKDCLKEEIETMKKSGLDKKEVSNEIMNRSKKWYFSFIKEYQNQQLQHLKNKI